MRPLALIAVFVVATVAAEATAEGLDPGAPDGAERTASRSRNFDTYALPVGPFGPGTIETRELSGKVVWSGYRIAENAPATAEIMATYRAKLQDMGLVPLFECSGDACGGFDFRFGASLLPAPAMLLDVRDFAQLSAGRAEPEGYASILLSRVNEKIYIQFIESILPPIIVFFVCFAVRSLRTVVKDTLILNAFARKIR
jgi:OOP family OmpA-OmpF porin